MLDGLLIATPFPPFKGGIQKFLYDSYTRLPGLPFRVLTTDQPGAWEFDARQALTITRVRRPRSIPSAKNLPLLLSAARIAARDKVKRIHCGVVLPDGIVGYALRKLMGKPYVVYAYARELYGPPKREAAISRILTNAQTVITISRFTRQRLLDLGVDAGRIEMIYPGVDVDFFTPREKDPRPLSALGLEGKKVILSVGRLVERKGVDTVIKALPQVVKAVPESRYLVAGDGEYLPQLRRLTSDLGMQDYVLFAGSPEDEEMPGYYSVCDVFTMVNRTLANNDCEGFGIVFLEAGACGRPVIGGNSGGVPDAIADGETGFLAHPSDTGDLAKLIIGLLNDSDLARRMGEAGRRRVVRDFTVQRQAQRLADLIGRMG